MGLVRGIDAVEIVDIAGVFVAVASRASYFVGTSLQSHLTSFSFSAGIPISTAGA